MSIFIYTDTVCKWNQLIVSFFSFNSIENIENFQTYSWILSVMISHEFKLNEYTTLYTVISPTWNILFFLIFFFLLSKKR